MSDKKKELEKLNQKIRECSMCSLWKTAKNAVPGEGSINSKIMFIGEAPGRQEDITGKPFIGRAGKLLSQLLEKAGIKREKVFITSIIKHRPPKNRKPRKKELKKCRFWWQKQIEILNPKKIIILGKTAFDEIVGLGEFKDCRGRWLKINNRFYLPLYHPAAALRSPKKARKILEKDFKSILKVF